MAGEEEDQVRELLVALSNLVNRIARVFASVSYLESQVTSLRTQVTTLRAQVTEAEQKNRSLEARSLHTENILQKTLNSAAQVTHECAQLRNNVQKLKAKEAALEKRKEEEIGKMQKKVRNLVGKVAIYESKVRGPLLNTKETVDEHVSNFDRRRGAKLE
ncbi:hypothetical protein PHLCEN_2v95 [Hermanssonia centrifuga]|uniref:Uncharacterized protein n=1 Tax=Hermanssonia centrifuga TaxID=98765 RepID=A0A2R6S6Z3_9APHY|nr:hypothetical protein PHLCEN_2v95 [Hermanssonia centrifuga]